MHAHVGEADLGVRLLQHVHHAGVERGQRRLRARPRAREAEHHAVVVDALRLHAAAAHLVEHVARVEAVRRRPDEQLEEAGRRRHAPAVHTRHELAQAQPPLHARLDARVVVHRRREHHVLVRREVPVPPEVLPEPLDDLRRAVLQQPPPPPARRRGSAVAARAESAGRRGRGRAAAALPGPAAQQEAPRRPHLGAEGRKEAARRPKRRSGVHCCLLGAPRTSVGRAEPHRRPGGKAAALSRAAGRSALVSKEIDTTETASDEEP